MTSKNAEGFWLDYVEQVKDKLPANLPLTPEHYSDMMQSYIGKVSVKEAVKRVMALKPVIATKKPKSTKKTEKVYL